VLIRPSRGRRRRDPREAPPITVTTAPIRNARRTVLQGSRWFTSILRTHQRKKRVTPRAITIAGMRRKETMATASLKALGYVSFVPPI
jgi:hypothetical protein